MLEHYKKIGVSAIELLPIHSFLDDNYLIEKGLRNYWGYNTINFFSPEARYASSGDRGEQVAEFKAMVRDLHRQARGGRAMPFAVTVDDFSVTAESSAMFPNDPPPPVPVFPENVHCRATTVPPLVLCSAPPNPS